MLVETTLSETILVGTTLSETILVGTTLSETILVGTTLSETILVGTTLFTGFIVFEQNSLNFNTICFPKTPQLSFTLTIVCFATNV
ncbi:MAG: pentapeptide repeat-containing protein [Candidatus Pacebacteria bacterium]|nr:pentapeptide repeat-containing protein [Candidatus Paceibacterota bacterium]